MKILIQHTLKDPQDWVEIDSDQWAGIPKKAEPRVGRPQGNSGINNQPGWIYDLNIQGVHFGGADHLAVEDLSGGSVRVTTWYDDPEDYPEGEKYARVWTLGLLQPDANLGGAINTKQSQVVYAQPLAAEGIRGVVLPWADFVPPTEDITRHGIWISDVLSKRHEDIQTHKGWRDWGAHLAAGELDENGRVKTQRDLGRWSKAKGTITYFQRDTDRADPELTAEHEDALELSTDTLASETATVPFEDSNYQAWTFATASNEPNSADWPDGDYRIQYDVSAIESNAAITSTIFRRANSSLISQENLGTDTTDITTTGLSIHSVTHNPDSGAAGDRFKIQTNASNSNMNMDKTITLDLNTTDSFADGPWVAAGANPKGPLGHPLHGPFGGPV